MKTKYKLTPDTKVVDGVTVHRIQAVRCFSDVTAGDLGGFVEHGDNLSHEGDCWIYDEACVLGRSTMEGRTTITGVNISWYFNASDYKNIENGGVSRKINVFRK